MADKKKLVNSKKLKTAYWKNLNQSGKVAPQFKYNPVADSISFYLESQAGEKIIVHYVDDHVSLLYRLSDKEIVGLKIEAFEKSFLPKYAELERVWKLSDTDVKLEDFADLQLAVQQQQWPIAQQISKVTEPIIKKQGIQLEELVLA